jgi:hypothetical protein
VHVVISNEAMKLLISKDLDEIYIIWMEYHLFIKNMYLHPKCNDYLKIREYLSDFIYYKMENLLLNFFF